MLWSKQYLLFRRRPWLEEHGAPSSSLSGRDMRNQEWFHLVNDDIISMPDKWEYPWYAAWDLAFHALRSPSVDLDFAKQQLELLLRDVYLHPNGQIPAYEWNFSDVNPPVHAWATCFVYRTEKALRGDRGPGFPQTVFRQADAELHLVGEPQRPVRQERL